MKLWLWLVVALITISSAFAADFYVDNQANGGNSGSSWGNAWQSFEDISWGSIGPGDTVYLSGGTDSKVYYERFLVGNVQGTDVNPVTITKGVDAGHNGRVIMDGSSGARDCFKIGGSSGYSTDHITISKLELRGCRIGFYIQYRASNLVFDSLTVTDWTSTGLHTAANDPDFMRGITIQNSDWISSPLGGTDAIELHGSGDHVIRNNYIHIRNAQFENPHVDGILAMESEGFLVYNNVIILDANAQGQASIIRAWADSSSEDPVVIYNNFMYQGGTYDSNEFQWTSVLNLRYQDQAGQVEPPTYVLHNTIVSNGPYVAGVVHEVPSTFVNNIVAQFGDGAGSNPMEPNEWLEAMRNSAGTINVDDVRNNLIWREWSVNNPRQLFQGNPGVWVGNGNSLMSFGWSDWVNTLGGTGVNENPLFVADFVPNQMTNEAGLNGELQAGSPAIDQGEDIQALVESFGLPWTDMNGNPRDSTPDIGAYEFGGTPPPTCSQLGGNVCQQGQACEGGNFQYSSDHGFLCCVGGTCSTPPPPPGGTDGDVNGDGVVDLQDLTIIAIHYGSTSGFPPGADQNNDGIVDVIDLTIVATHYGASGGGSGDGFLPGAIIEAEEGTLESPMQTVTGNGASGSYVHTPTANQGKVSYTFQISTPGQYSLDVKERSPSQGANSFFIGLDGEQANGNNYYVYDSQESSSFIWDPISLRGPTGTFDHSDFDPMVWQLSAGEHTFHFYGREYQTGIDQLRLIPSGLPVGDCIPGETESCSTGLQGICAQGTKTCGADGYWGSCVAPDPETEICGDDLDSDCDGNINNGCEGICDTDQDFHDEFFWCIGGGPNDDCNDDDPTIYPGHAEICDGKDNDCDGAIDEGCVSSSSVSRQMTSNSVDPGQVIIVKLQVIISDPTHEESFYAIEETVPQGWTVLNAGGGTLTENVIRWATLQSAQTTLYTYSVKAPTSSATYSFVGNYFIQGMNAPETIPGDSLVTVTQPQQYCSDQTLYGQCSNNQPLFCQDGDLMNNCQACGCPSGETCNGDGGCLG